jgi:4-diphosphocytidyl-2-C-methyl-D-erythritol kinase
MQVRAYAKINWSLRITGRRGDGFHDLETLFQQISLHDTLTIERADRFTVTCDDPSIPTDDSNLVLRAARAVDAPPVAIHIEKRIPAGGGLGGGSADAAATLTALAAMFGIDAPLADLALSIGSDVPFFLEGGTAYATGRGEVLTPLPPPSAPIPLLLVLPEERVLTAAAFRMLRRFSPRLGVAQYRAMLANDLLAHGADLINDFEEPIFAALPSLALLKQQLLDAGATWAAMSGSGSTMVGAFRDAATRDAALPRFAVKTVAAETMDREPIARQD